LASKNKKLRLMLPTIAPRRQLEGFLFGNSPMTRTRTILFALVAAAITVNALAAPQAVEEADLILRNGDISIPEGWARAVAVKGGVIVAVGEDTAVEPFKGAETRVVDLQGAAVVPGLHDMHVHPTGAGLWQARCMFPQGSSARTVVDTVKGCIAKKGKGTWITGGSWDVASFGATPPDRKLLDVVSPDNPVFLNDISGHSALANSKALALAGITKDTPNPPGGIIEHNSDGQPNGVLRDGAEGLVAHLIPPATADENAAALKWALDTMLAQGVTSITDAGTDEPIMRAYALLADRGELKTRVRGCFMWRPTVFTASYGTGSPIERMNLYARDRFKPDCIKIVLDGVPTDGHTAAMLEPYADASHQESDRAKGLLMVPQGVLNAAVTDFDRRGLTVKFHAAGDAAVHAGLDAIEAARRANGYSGLHHDVGHNSFVALSDIPRGRQIGATFEMSPYIWYPNPIIPDIAKAIGPERMKRWIPVKDAIDSGALVVPGSDWPVVPTVSPWIAIETLVTRQAPGGGGEVLGGAEKITLQQAFDLFTVKAAEQMGDRYRTGLIQKGLLADLVVLDRNPYKVPVTDIHNTKVKLTLINGEVVYRAGQPAT
jgi:predicted amidohydrolase YtcJ